MSGQKTEWTEGRVDRQTSGQKDEWTEDRVDRRQSGGTNSKSMDIPSKASEMMRNGRKRNKH